MSLVTCVSMYKVAIKTLSLDLAHFCVSVWCTMCDHALGSPNANNNILEGEATHVRNKVQEA